VRASRWGIVLWSVLIVILVFVEVAEVTHLFTLPIESAFYGDPTTFVGALVFTTILALVGAVYIGIYVSARLLRTQGFTPFEEEMLRMRAEIRDIKAAVDRLTAAETPPSDTPPADPPKGGTP
jgi:hypothetical protein